MVNIYKQKLTILQEEIVRLLFIKSGNILNARKISKLLDVSPPAVAKSIQLLVKLELIKVEQDKESRRWSIELNRENHKVIQLKRADNLRLIYESGLADFLEREFAGANVILFGSYSRGEDIYSSDIDIAVIGRKRKDTNLELFNKILEREIRINFYESYKNIHKNLRDNILNGIVLTGRVDL